MTATEPILKRSDDLGMAEAFGRDLYLRSTIQEIIHEFRITEVQETGAWRGYTTRVFRNLVQRVSTIEINETFLREAQETCANTDITFQHGDSGELLKHWTPKTNPGCDIRPLFYLDAHWYSNWPILSELEAISEIARDYQTTPVIVVHDVKVPNNDTLGYDTYQGQPLTFEFLKSKLDLLPFKWRHAFNGMASGHRRGVLFIVPCKN